MENKGKIFEKYFKQSVEQENIFVYRLRDNAMSYTESESVFTHKNQCDFFVFKTPFLYAFELKHTKYPSLSIQINKTDDNKKMIKYEQIQSLFKMSQYDGVKAGFILSFENEKADTESTFFIDIDNFINFLGTSGKKSINILDIAKNGGIRVQQYKKRKYYHYEIQDLLSRIK